MSIDINVSILISIYQLIYISITYQSKAMDERYILVLKLSILKKIKILKNNDKLVSQRLLIFHSMREKIKGFLNSI